MLIRSQNKQNLFNMNIISGIGFAEYDTCKIFAVIDGKEYLLGDYSTKEKAIKVLDMIEDVTNAPIYINDTGNGEYAKYFHPSFQMPQDNDVE